MTDREALLAAVRASPNDDLPRLVYADWLEENASALGDREAQSARDRAVFIRAQIDAARAEPFSPPAREAATRSDKLLHSINRELWTEHLRGKILDYRFERGFIEHVVVDIAQFPEVAESIFAGEPVRSLRGVRPSHAEYEVILDPFLATPELAQVTALDMENAGLQATDECDKLLDTPHLANLTHLSLRCNPVNPAWLRRTLEEDHWPNLTRLNLADNPHLGSGISAALRNANHRRFTRLDLSGVRFESHDLKRALAGKSVSEVEELRLCWYGGDDWPGALTELELGWVMPWEHLRLLDMEGQGIGSQGVKELLNHDNARSIRCLGLARNHLGPSGVDLLLEPSALNLFYLDMRYNDLRPKDALALQKRFPDAQILV